MLSVKPRSHGLHELDWMCIGSLHMNLHKIDAHSMHIHLQKRLGCAFKQDCIIIHDSCKVTPITRSSACLLDCGACYIAPLCSALAVTLDKKEACFLWPRRAVQHGKIIITMVQLQYLVLTYNRAVHSESVTSLRTVFQHCPGKLI